MKLRGGAVHHHDPLAARRCSDRSSSGCGCGCGSAAPARGLGESCSAACCEAGGGPLVEEEADRSLVMQVALKCADVGHLAAPWEVHHRWVSGLEEEFFRQVRDSQALPVEHTQSARRRASSNTRRRARLASTAMNATTQGDREKAARMAVSPLMDRCKDGITKSQVRPAGALLLAARLAARALAQDGCQLVMQPPPLTLHVHAGEPGATPRVSPPPKMPQVGFFDIVALPLFSSWAAVFPESLPLVRAAEDNCSRWRLLEAGRNTHTGGGSVGSAGGHVSGSVGHSHGSR